jgi:hypothetical protein
MKFDRCQPNGGTKTSEQSLHLAASRRCPGMTDDRKLRSVLSSSSPSCERSCSRCEKMRNSWPKNETRRAPRLDLEVSFGDLGGNSTRSSLVNRSRIQLDLPSSRGPHMRSSLDYRMALLGAKRRAVRFSGNQISSAGRNERGWKKSGNREIRKARGTRRGVGRGTGFDFASFRQAPGFPECFFDPASHSRPRRG